MRHYTVDEANALLPNLRPLLEDLQGLDRRMRHAVALIQEFEKLAVNNGHGEHADALRPEHDVEDIGRDMQERLLLLEAQSIVLKDIRNGIVDFPSRLRGRDVYLCWRLGEETVSHWHDTDAGFAGRQRL